MPVSTDSPAPYAPGTAVIGLLQRIRTRGLSVPITKDVLLRAGISDSLAPRTFQSLVTLDLIDESGQPQPTLEKLRSAPEAEYKAVLAAWIQSAYAEVFQFADPRLDDAVRVRDAFRSYTPHGQQDRMVSLFMALCAEAGIVEVTNAESKQPARKTTRPSTSPNVRAKVPTRNQLPPPPPPPPPRLTTGLAPALAGMIESIPKDGKGWTKEDRDKFVLTFGAVLDYAVPVVSAESLRLPVEDVVEEDTP